MFIKRTVLKLDFLYDRKIYCSQACACTFKPGNFTGWGNDGVNLGYTDSEPGKGIPVYSQPKKLHMLLSFKAVFRP